LSDASGGLAHPTGEDSLLEKKPAHVADDTEWKRLNRKALSVIRLTRTINVAYLVAKETTAYGIMKGR
jgi:hypothetical protein